MFIRGAVLLAISTMISACTSGGASYESAQSKALSTSIAAMSSLGTANLSFAFADVGSQSTSLICDDDGAPLSANNDAEWAFHAFLCAGAHNTYSPDSALGALSLMKGIVCTVDNQGVTYTASGTSVTLSDVRLATPCFQQAMLDKFAQEGISTVSGTVTAYQMSSSGWDYRVEFTNFFPVGDFKLYIRNSDNVIASAFVSMAEGEPTDSWTITIDRRGTPNALIYEAANRNRHMRIMAEGTISESGEVGEVIGMAGIIAEESMNQYVSLRGEEANGLQVKWQKNGQAASDGGTCYDVGSTGGTCVGVTALAFTSTERPGFALADNEAAAAPFAGNPVFMTVAAFPVDNVSASFSSPLR